MSRSDFCACTVKCVGIRIDRRTEKNDRRAPSQWESLYETACRFFQRVVSCFLHHFLSNRYHGKKPKCQYRPGVFSHSDNRDTYTTWITHLSSEMQRYRKVNVTSYRIFYYGPSGRYQYRYTHTHTYIYIYIHEYVCVCVCIYIYVCVHIHRSLSTEKKPRKADSDIEIYNVLIYKRRNGEKETDWIVKNEISSARWAKGKEAEGEREREREGERFVELFFVRL